MSGPAWQMAFGMALLAGANGVAWGEAERQEEELIRPADLEYRGAFRLPGREGEDGWGWGGQAIAYWAAGDPNGPDDGHPGSLFGAGHAWRQQISEISLPQPVVSRAKSLNDLNTAGTLQPFRNIRGSLFGELEQARVGLACLPAQGRQKTPKLYFCWGPHMHEGERVPSHGWCELNLADPKPAGPWRIGDEWNYVTTHYLFPIPQAWAEKYASGMCLATGRFRDGGQGSQGPTLFAIGPWLDGDPPAAGVRLKATPLLRYSPVTDDRPHTLKGYHHSDEWSGGAWLTAGRRSAVVFVGTKGEGKCWYGFANGVVWPDEEPFPPIPDPPNDQRGWWSERFVGRMLFYDPRELAEVAQGRKKPFEPQPYATLDLDPVLFGVKSRQQWYHVGGAGFDPQRGFLYVVECRADGDKPLLHVWRVKP